MAGQVHLDEGQVADAVGKFKGGAAQMQTLSSDMNSQADALSGNGMKGAAGEALRSCAQDWKNISGKVALVLEDISQATDMAGKDIIHADQSASKRFGRG